MKEILCKIFGHKYDFIEMQMWEILAVAQNTDELDETISCQRCGRTLVKSGRYYSILETPASVNDGATV